MKKHLHTHWPFFLFLLLLLSFYFWGVEKVPFHPDESTQLFMSNDFELLLSSPSSMAWDPEKESDLRQRYRELDAPLTKYILGIGLNLRGYYPPQSDWDWGKTWDENKLAGVLPDPELLNTGRFSITLLLPFSLFFIYLLGDRLDGRLTGFFSAFFVGTHALTLLHARRAMAEGPLIFGVSLALWSLLETKKRPWLTGICMAIAFNAKQSTLALFPVGLLAINWQILNKDQNYLKLSSQIIQYLASFMLLTFLLNPIFWQHPIDAMQASWRARQNLLHRQIADTARLAPEQLLKSPGQRIAVIIGNIYLIPPRFEEVGNYSEQILSSKEIYLSIPGHNLLRGAAGGGFMLTLTLVGLSINLLNFKRITNSLKKNFLLLLIATAFQAIGLIITIPLPFQRYSIPMVPFISIWSGYGLAQLITIKTKKSPNAYDWNF